MVLEEMILHWQRCDGPRYLKIWVPQDDSVLLANWNYHLLEFNANIFQHTMFYDQI